MRLVLTIAATFVLLVACGGPKPAPAPAKPDTNAVCCDSGTCASCTGSDTVGAVCDTTLDTTAARAPAAAKPDRPKPEPVAAKSGGAPRMWDFGSTTCVPCKTMKGILDPMMVDYNGKVDVRIIDVYKEKELAREYRIVTIPTQVFIDAAGKELYRHVGVYPRDSIEACFAKFGFPVVAGNPPPAPSAPTGGT